MSARVAILLSGRGSNFLALHGAMERGEVPARIERVISNVPDAAGLARAKDLRIPALAYPHRLEPSREAHEAKILAALGQAEIDWICLAGYMRKLSESFIAQYPERILNIHPSLLPAFPGMEPQKQALEHGVKVSGCTVHLVDETLDQGPIVVQRTVPVKDDDTVDSLASRILSEEHKAYPDALNLLLTERWEVRGRRVVFLHSGRLPGT
jgi:phosphoribosylglycinamide formyltransferase 1